MVLPRVFERSGGIYAKVANRKARQLRSAYLIEGLGEQAVVSVNCRIVRNPEVIQKRGSEKRRLACTASDWPSISLPVLHD